MDTKYTITHGGDILATGLSATAAVLYAARYDGWGAEFLRDENGKMALRQSPRHIGNNDWLARGDEPALFGVRSDLDDDDQAIEAVVEKLIGEVEKLHKLMDISDTKNFLKYRLKMAIENLDEYGPGKWSIADYDDCVQLYYTLDVVETETEGEPAAPHPELYKDSGAVWSKWGGDEILSAVPDELNIQKRDAGGEGYKDKYGDHVYSEYINLYFDAE